MQPEFRPARASDLDAILTFMRLLHDQDGLSFDEPTHRRVLAGIVRDESLGRVWVIDEAGVPVGYMVLTLGYSLEYRGRDAFVDELFVREDRRRRGIGRRAMQVMEQACRELEVRELHLEVERGNVAAQELYRRFGFVDHDRYLMSKAIEPG